MLQGFLRGQHIVTLKAEPADAKILCEAYPQITPGYHMNKRNWITLCEGADPNQQTFGRNGTNPRS